MHGPDIFTPLLTLFAVAFCAAALMRLIRIPTIIGFLAAGMIAGPSGLDLLDAKTIHGLSELGVVLLLFTIGLELSLDKLWVLRREALFGGGVQVVVSIAAGWGIARFTGLSGGTSLAIGFFVALSSTAVVLRLLTERGVVDTPQGKISLAVLLFQDVAVIPMMLVLPLLVEGGSGFTGVLLVLGKAILIAVLVLGAARRGVPWLMHRVRLFQSREGFLLGIASIVFLITWLTMKAGLSPALGAFIAGLVISETEHRHLALAETVPFRDLFLSIFFISVGMLLDLGSLLSNPIAPLLLAIGIYLGKGMIIASIIRVLGYPGRTAIQAGGTLGQVGEFSFVLLLSAVSLGLLDTPTSQTLLSGAAITLLITPFAMMLGRRSAPNSSTIPVNGDKERASTEGKHVVIIGFGHLGRTIAKALKALGVEYLVAEMNPKTVRTELTSGEPIIRGDACKPEVLEALHVHDASAAVIAINDPAAVRPIIFRLRKDAPGLFIIVRTRFASELDELAKLGADLVVPDELETSLQVAGHLLRHLGVPGPIIGRRLDDLRSEGYGMHFHPISHTANHATTDEMDLRTVTLEEGDIAIGHSLVDLDLRRKTGTTVIAIFREGTALLDPAHTPLKAGDRIVLTGNSQLMAHACDLLRRNAETEST